MKHKKIIIPLIIIVLVISLVIIIDINVIKEHHGYPITAYVFLPLLFIFIMFCFILAPIIYVIFSFYAIIRDLKNKNIELSNIIGPVLINTAFIFLIYFMIKHVINFEMKDLPNPLFDTDDKYDYINV